MLNDWAHRLAAAREVALLVDAVGVVVAVVEGGVTALVNVRAEEAVALVAGSVA